MQSGQYLDFFMESIEATEAKVAAADRKATSTEMLVYEAEGRALEAKLAFQQAKRHVDIAMDDAESSAKKLKQAGEWLASMHKRIIEAHQQEVQLTKEARTEITNLKVSAASHGLEEGFPHRVH